MSGTTTDARWAALAGAAREGRDRVIDALLVACRADGLVVGGFRPREGAGRDERGKMIDILLENVATRERMPFAVTDPLTPDICSYRFDPAVLAAAVDWCRVAARDADVVLLVGLGPAEAAGGGHAGAIRAAMQGPGRALPLLAIRRDALAAIALPLPDPVAALELPADDAAMGAFVRAVVRAARRKSV